MKTLRIAHLSDWHTTPLVFEQNISDKLAECRNVLNKDWEWNEYGPPPKIKPKDIDLVLVTGDMVANTANRKVNLNLERDQQKEDWDAMSKVLRNIFPNAGFFAVEGNHDYTSYKNDVFLTVNVDGQRFGKMVISGFRGTRRLFGEWQNELNDRELMAAAEALNPESNIVLTHTPPYGVLDYSKHGLHTGVPGLKQELINKTGVRLHAFGHIHEQGGKTEFWMPNLQFSNGSYAINCIEVTL